MRIIIFLTTILFISIIHASAAENTEIIGIGEVKSGIDVKLECLNCHVGLTPTIVDEWTESKHGLVNVKCYVCHGTHEKGFDSDDFIAKPQKERCRSCHAEQVKTLSESKMSDVACNTCHPVHQFSKEIASKSETCITCHQGQGEMYKGSMMEKMNVQCSNCHFHEEYLDISSHGFEVDIKSCNKCHDSSRFGQIAGIQDEISGLLFKAKEGNDEHPGAVIVENDGSKGFHNPKKAKELLTTPGKTSGDDTGYIKPPSTKFLVELNIFLVITLLAMLYKRERDNK